MGALVANPSIKPPKAPIKAIQKLLLNSDWIDKGARGLDRQWMKVAIGLIFAGWSWGVTMGTGSHCAFLEIFLKKPWVAGLATGVSQGGWGGGVTTGCQGQAIIHMLPKSLLVLRLRPTPRLFYLSHCFESNLCQLFNQHYFLATKYKIM